MNIDDVSISNNYPNALGRVLNLRIRRGVYNSPKFRFIRSKFERYDGKEVIEIYVLFEKPIPVRDSALILRIGECRMRVSSEHISDSEIKFIIFEHDKSKEGFPISIGWAGDDPDKMILTGYYYNPPP